MGLIVIDEKIKKILFILILIIFFVLLGVLFIPAQQQEKTTQEIEKVIELEELSLMDFGEQQRVAVAYLKVEPQTTKKQKVIFIIFQDYPLTKLIYVNGKWAGATKNEELKKMMKKSAQSYGFEFKEIEIEQLDKEEEGIIFIPSGVWPLQLSDSKEKLNQKSILVYMGTNQDITIDKNGKIIKGGISQLVLNSTKQMPFFIEAYKNEEKTNFIFIKSTIDQIKDFKKFSDKFFEMILLEQKDKIKKEEKEFSKNYLGVLKAFEDEQYAILLYFEDEQIQQTWIKKINTYQGRVITSKKSETGAVPLQLILKVSENQKLNFYARVLDKNLNQVYLKKVGSFDGNGNIWIGSVPYLNLPNSKYSIIEIIDQYKRVYAKALVEGVEYNLKLVNSRGSAREYCITKDNKEYNVREILVKKEGENEWKKIEVINSCFSISSKWKEDNKLYFKIDEFEFLDEWKTTSNRWKVFTEIGIPAAIIFLIWFIFFRKEKNNVFLLEVPEYAPLEQLEVVIDKKEILSFVDDVKKFEEIRKFLFEKVKADKGLAITTESIENVLIELSNRGELKRYSEYYAPINMPQEEFEEKVSKMSIKEFLQRNGVLLNKNMIDSKGRKWFVFNLEFEKEFKKDFPNFIVFLNEERKIKFLEKLKTLAKEEYIKILIALYTSKLKIKTVEELAKEQEYY
ncbi:MAG: hypothetical protein NC918_00130 [Candidatus Omnitrophica bacterium]|nr:hypothetical protein [Candidatus Omnitrophota bacterium]